MNLFEETIEAMKEMYPDIVLGDSGDYATHMITPIKKLTIYDGKKPGEWDLTNVNTNETISAGEADDAERLLIAEVMQELTKQQKNVERELTNERLNYIQNTKTHDTQTYGEDPGQWVKPENVTPSNLPVSSGGIVRPVVSAADALAAWKEFQALKQAIIEPSDKQTIEVYDKRTGTKKKTAFIKKSGWRKLATCFNLTDQIVSEIKEPTKSGGFLWKIKVLCRAPNGRECEGIGMCSSDERGFAHPDHDVYATAHTRAKNRAISDMIAAGEVSAEELEA